MYKKISGIVQGELVRCTWLLFMDACCVISYLVICENIGRMFEETGRLKTVNRIVYM